jgi:hypothetical protein
MEPMIVKIAVDDVKWKVEYSVFDYGDVYLLRKVDFISLVVDNIMLIMMTGFLRCPA